MTEVNRQLAPDLTVSLRIWAARLQAGLLAGALAVTFSLSHASLVTGTVAPAATPALVGMALTGTAVICLLMGLFSGITGLVSLTQDVPAVALGAIVVTMIQAPLVAEAGNTTASVVALTLTATLIFGVTFQLAGFLGLGKLVRFAPMPMIAGFLAGTGWLVVLGAVGVSTGIDPTLANLPDLLSGPAGAKLAVAAIGASLFAVAPFVLSRQFALPAVLAFMILAINLGAWALGIPRATLLENGWFIQFAESGRMWPPLPAHEILAVDPAILLPHAFPMVTMVALATIAILMNAAALELDTRSDLDLNRELRVLGIGNFMSGLLCGMPGYHGVSATLASHQLASANRASAVFASFTVALVIFFGDRVLSFIPLPALGAFLISVGGGLLHTWLIRAVRRARPAEAGLLLLIFAVIVQVGLFEGTVFGLLAGSLLFVFDYSRMDPIRSIFYADSYRGSSELPDGSQELLRQHGTAIAVVKIQGFVFFATAHRLRMRIMEILRRRQEVRYLLLDFEAAYGMDSTAVLSFQRIADDLRDRHVTALLSGVSPEISAVFARSGLALDEAEYGLQIRDDLDTALLELEARLLDDLGGAQQDAEHVAIETILERVLGMPDMRARLMPYLERLDLAPGELLCEQGAPADAMFFLESGMLSILLASEGAPRHLRRLEPGAVVGEIALYLDTHRTATVAALGKAVAWRLSSQSLARMQTEAPDLLACLHQGMARALARRVEANTRLIETLRA